MRTSLVTVEWSSSEPVYEQIARQIRAQVVAGELAAGTPLPPVRTLASDLGVNLNTVARAYRLLEEEGFVRIRHRSGAEVAAPAERPESSVVDRLRGELRGVLARLRQAGVPPDELRRMAEREIAALAPSREGEGGPSR
jgi:DNA-binding transcriptional regulator YhcF (GntR family)